MKLLTVSADMAEAAGLSGIRGGNALVPCRFCELPKTQFNASSMRMSKADQQIHQRQVHIVNRYRKKCKDCNLRPSALEKAMRPKGLKEKPSVVQSEGPSFNPYRQVALDIAHSEQKGIGEKLIIKLVDDFLSKKVGLRQFAKVLKRFQLPPGASKIPNTAKRVKTLKMSEVTMTVSMLPFILQRMDHNKKIFKPSVLAKMNLHRDPTDKLDNKKLKLLLIDTFMTVSKANHLLFGREVRLPTGAYEEDPYAEMEEAILLAREKIFALLAPLEAYAKEEAQKKQAFQDLSEQALFAMLKREAEEKRRAKERGDAQESSSEEDNEDELEDDEGSEMSESETSSDESDVGPQRRLSRRGRGASNRGGGRGTNSRGRGKGTSNTSTSNGKRKKQKGVLPLGIQRQKKIRIPTSLSSLPNYHNALHETPNSRQNGTSRNVSTSLGEIQHQIFKLLVAHSNYYDLDLVFLRYANNMFAIRNILDGGTNSRGGYRGYLRFYSADVYVL